MNPPPHNPLPRRSRRTRPLVKLTDRVAGALIRVGGIGTIAAVMTVFFFLLWVSWPLLQPAQLGSPQTKRSAEPPADSTGKLVVDEYRQLGWLLDDAGHARAIELATGKPCGPARPLGTAPLTAIGPLASSGKWPCGFADGSVALVQVAIASNDLSAAESAAQAVDLAPEQSRSQGDLLLYRTAQGKLREQRLVVEADAPLVPAGGPPIQAVDYLASSSGARLAVLDEAGQLRVVTTKTVADLETGEKRKQLTQSQLPWQPRPGRRVLKLFFLGGSGILCAVWDDGRLVRYDARKLDTAHVTEELNLVEAESQLTSLEPLAGRGTLLAGDSRGRLHVWFPIRPPGAETSDRVVLVKARTVSISSAPITAVATSARKRLAAVATGDEQLALLNITTGSVLDRSPVPLQPVARLALAPKDDAVVALGRQGVCQWALSAPHPEATPGALFGPVWYEGYPQPSYTWQSTSATDDFEPKLGLWPLVFGTLKGTCYAMLFAVPIALGAAIYSSEFMNRSLRGRVKPTIELMASLPSVVLGFLGALVIAPWVEQIVLSVLAALVTVPLAILIGAGLWQMLPSKVLFRWSQWRLWAVAAAVGAGCAAAGWVGPLLQDRLFEGDLHAWLDSQTPLGRPWGGWWLILLPVAGLFVATVLTRNIDPWMRSRTTDWSRKRLAPIELAKLLAGVVAALFLAWIGAASLDWAGFDPRGTIVDSYVQRNALVVGAMMGFAIIPLIYTIAEDALSTVPQSLRSASLGAGATPWQTAVRIVIPVATSGLFSAVMVGLGRAVGETMIVLMAAGNTPVLDWNIFNGFRTLSANLAVELPEAARHSTHYRTLFLSALVLFSLTFVINTVAEAVRQRFRRRAYEL